MSADEPPSRPVKIAICTPVHGDVRAGYSRSLAQMLIHTGRTDPAIALTYLLESCSNVALARQRLVDQALEQDADWVLWIDSDHDFPPDALLQLLARREPFIGCNQSRREAMARPCAGYGYEEDEFVWTTPDKVRAGLVETVEWMGLAFVLVSMDAIRKAEAPLFMDADDGEDVVFCRRLKAAGFPPRVDHRLSAQVGHIGLKRYTTADSIQQKQIREMSATMRGQRRPG